jgi:hypothetical protein
VNLGTFTKHLKRDVFVPIIVKAVQELSNKYDALEARIQALENL